MSARPALAVIHGPVFGGAHNQLLKLHGPLLERGFECVAVVPEEAGAAAERLRDGGVETVEIALARMRASANPRVQATSFAGLRRDHRRLRALIRERGAALVQVHGVVNPQAGLAAAREADTAIVWQLLDTRAPMSLRRAVMPVATRLADAITSWGMELARTHPGATSLRERLVVVFPPVDAERLRPDADARLAARARLDIGADDVLVATVGVRNPQKGHEHFVRGATVAAAGRPRARFRVIGAPSPPHAAHMRAVEDEAGALGLGDPGRLAFVDPGTDVPLLMQAIDVFVMSSVPRSEGMPTAILEAMACAKPVVTTDVGAIRELVRDGETALVVEAGDDQALGAAIARMVDDPGLRERLGEAGRRRALDEFSLGRLADLHARAYELALAHRAGRR